MRYQIEDEFPCDISTYWRIFFDAAYNDALFQTLNIEREVLECEPADASLDGTQSLRRVQRLTPRRDMPAVMKRVIGGSLHYMEHNEFNAERNEILVRTIPNVMAEKIVTQGHYRLETIGPAKVKRIWDGECRCSIPLVGSKIEKIIVDEVKESYAKTTTFTREWLTKLA